MAIMMSTIKIMGGENMQLLETTFSNLESEQKEGKLVIEIKITTTETGKYKLYMLAHSYEPLTRYIFVRNVNTGEYGVRELTENNVYKDDDSLNDEYLEKTYEFVYMSEAYEDIITKIDETLRKVDEYRKKVRERVISKNFIALI